MKKLRTTIEIYSRLTLTVVIGLLFISYSDLVFGQSGLPNAKFNFSGRMLVAVSDADMAASAYFDGKLGVAEGSDALAVIRLDKPLPQLRAVEVGVINTVTGPPVAVAVTPDGKYAIVGERLGQRPANKANAVLSDFPLSKLLNVVNLSDPDYPKIVQRVNGPERATSVSINADGSLIAVSSFPKDTTQTPLTIYRFADGKLSDPSTPTIHGWTSGDVMRNATFHPKQNKLALLDLTKSAVVFVQLNPVEKKISLSPWGNTVSVEKAPFLARFTPDGNYVVVNASYGAEDILENGWGAPRGIVSSIKVFADSAADGSPVHQLVSHAETGVNPEGMNISPDGKWVMTTNVEPSAMPIDNP